MEKKILITSGDPDGIGFEVTAKALQKLGPQKNFRFIYFRSPKAAPSLVRKIQSKFKVDSVSSWDEAQRVPLGDHTRLVEIVSRQPAAKWVETAAMACHLGAASALVTGPMSKTSIIESGMKDIGHTEILKRISGERDVFMGFIGSEFSVVLTTGHCSLKDVSQKLSKDLLVRAVRSSMQLIALANKKSKGLPIGVLGLNPHSGESGLLGNEEIEMIQPTIQALQKEGVPVVGPLPPDSAFEPSSQKKHSVFVAMYHDQGLIPFKAVHGFESGVHVTLGLPFIRTSVDHGTAKDLFGRDKAKYESMLEALKWAMKLAR